MPVIGTGVRVLSKSATEFAHHDNGESPSVVLGTGTVQVGVEGSQRHRQLLHVSEEVATPVRPLSVVGVPSSDNPSVATGSPRSSLTMAAMVWKCWPRLPEG